MTEVILYDPVAIESKMKLEAARLNIQRVLDGVAAIHWTEENVNQDLLAPARDAVKKLLEFKDAGKRPHLDANSAYEKAYKEVSTMIIAAAEAKANEKRILAQKIEKERARIEAEKRRIEEIRIHIARFITDYSKRVMEAETPEAIISIEKAIGSQLSRKAFFAEFFDEFVAKIDPIREIIAQRKELIREKNKIVKKLDAADPDSKPELSELKEDNEIGLMQNQAELYQATEIPMFNNTYVGESTAPVVVPSRRQWKYEITDLKLLHKNRPDLTEITPNEPAIRQLLSEYRKEGKLQDDGEISLPGLRFYQDKIYK